MAKKKRYHLMKPVNGVIQGDAELKIDEEGRLVLEAGESVIVLNGHPVKVSGTLTVKVTDPSRARPGPPRGASSRTR